MKNVLDYNIEELNNLSIEELEHLYSLAEDGENEYNTRQLVEKTLMNALFGATANQFFPLFNEEMASAITGNGRYFIRKLGRNIEEKLQSMLKSTKNYVIYSDTDSVYFQIEPFVNMYLEKNPNSSINETVDWVDGFEKKVIQPIIKQTVDDFCKELNAYNKDKIAADREIISDVGIFSAKKKYIARVRDSEGTRYPENDPYLKVMGLEIAKSSTPTWAKKKLKDSIHIILDNEYDDLMNWVSSIKSDFIKTDLNSIAQVGSASNLDYDIETSKGIPMGSRAAICHNNYLKTTGLDSKYSMIQAGDKSRRLFLTVPNKLKTNIISYNSDNFTNEIKDVIDYDTNFDKGFLNALQLMVNPLGWDLSKKTETLEDW
jgi:hypothetical protein